MLRAIRAITVGGTAVARAPVLIAVTYLLLVAAVTPGAIRVMTSFERAFTSRAVEVVVPGIVDAEWFERANDATGSAIGTTITPAIVGFAAQLSNIDDLTEADARAPIVLAPMMAWAVAWTLLLGGILTRYAGPATSVRRSFVAASIHCFPRFLVIATVTVAIYLIGAFAYRTAPPPIHLPLLVVLVFAVGITTVVASYARARIVLDDVKVRVAIAGGVQMLRTAWLSVTAHVLLACGGWIFLMMVLAWLDRRLGAGIGFWRPLFVAQAYVVARIVFRLVWEASALSLVRMYQTPAR
jgi:hypothetical protein